MVRVDGVRLTVSFEERTDGVVSRNSGQIEHRRADEALVDLASVAEFSEIACDRFQAFEELLFGIAAEQLLSQLYCPGGVFEDLHGFRSGHFIEEPAAAGVHQQEMPLEFEHAEATHLILGRQSADRMPLQKRADVRRRPIPNHRNVFIASQPWTQE